MKEILKNMIIIVVLIILGIFLINRLPYEKFQQYRVESVDLSKENLGDYKLNIKLKSNDIKSNQFTRAATDGNMQYTYTNDKKNYNHIRFIEGVIGVSNQVKGVDEVLGYMIYKNDIETEKGIKVGDTKDDVIKAYGDKYYTIKYGDKNYIGYIDKEEELVLKFHLLNDVVKRIDFNYLEVNEELTI